MGTYSRDGFCIFLDDPEAQALEFAGYGDTVTIVDAVLEADGSPMDPSLETVYFVTVKVEARRATAEESREFLESRQSNQERFWKDWYEARGVKS